MAPKTESQILLSLLGGHKRRRSIANPDQDPDDLLPFLRSLRMRGMVKQRGHDWMLTEIGEKMAKQIQESQQ